jgi:hypothetical protein
MSVEGLITQQDGAVTEIVGFTGSDLKCEGCGMITDALYETDDSVMLCIGCFEICSDD